MPFQKEVNQYKAWGVAGEIVGDSNEYYPLTLKADTTVGVDVGKFVWDNNGVAEGTTSGTAKPTGIVPRVLDNPILDTSVEYSMHIEKGRKVPVLVKGSVFVATSDAATVGNVLYVKAADGTITNAAAGTTSAGLIETGWKIVSLCDNASAAGQLCLVTNWV